MSTIQSPPPKPFQSPSLFLTSPPISVHKSPSSLSPPVNENQCTLTCYSCSMPSSSVWAKLVYITKKPPATANYYPTLFQLQEDKLIKDDGSTYLCAFCFALLESQWSNYEKLGLGLNERVYNLQKFVCSVCGVETYRKRVRALPFQDFPFLKSNPQPNSLTLRPHPLAIVCLDCSETLWAQSAEYERWGLPIQKRHFNWMARPPPPEGSMEATVARLPSGEVQLPRCPPIEPSVSKGHRPHLYSELQQQQQQQNTSNQHQQHRRNSKSSTSTTIGSRKSSSPYHHSSSSSGDHHPPIVTVAPIMMSWTSATTSSTAGKISTTPQQQHPSPSTISSTNGHRDYFEVNHFLPPLFNYYGRSATQQQPPDWRFQINNGNVTSFYDHLWVTPPPPQLQITTSPTPSSLSPWPPLLSNYEDLRVNKRRPDSAEVSAIQDPPPIKLPKRPPPPPPPPPAKDYWSSGNGDKNEVEGAVDLSCKTNKKPEEETKTSPRKKTNFTIEYLCGAGEQSAEAEMEEKQNEEETPIPNEQFIESTKTEYKQAERRLRIEKRKLDNEKSDYLRSNLGLLSRREVNEVELSKTIRRAQKGTLLPLEIVTNNHDGQDSSVVKMPAKTKVGPDNLDGRKSDFLSNLGLQQSTTGEMMGGVHHQQSCLVLLETLLRKYRTNPSHHTTGEEELVRQLGEICGVVTSQQPPSASVEEVSELENNNKQSSSDLLLNIAQEKEDNCGQELEWESSDLLKIATNSSQVNSNGELQPNPSILNIPKVQATRSAQQEESVADELIAKYDSVMEDLHSDFTKLSSSNNNGNQQVNAKLLAAVRNYQAKLELMEEKLTQK